jgi:hypothetical protein
VRTRTSALIDVNASGTVCNDSFRITPQATASFHVLFESSSGYALFSVLEQEEIGALLDEVCSRLKRSREAQRIELVVQHKFTFFRCNVLRWTSADSSALLN